MNEPTEPHPARLTNLSGRAPVGSGAQTLILGAVIEGSGTLPTLVRAIGPSLESFGVTTPLQFAPQLSVYTAGHLAAKTNRVSAAANAVSPTVGAFIAKYVPDELAFAIGDAALVGQAYAGSLTAHCDGSDNNRGIGMVEFYDCSNGAPTSPRFVNFSARGQVDPGDGVMIVGFAVAGQGSARLLLRATGPTLASFGVIGTIANPEIELYSGQSLLAQNDNWQDGGPVAAAAIQDAGSASGAFPITDAYDAAMIVTLPPGTYTLHVRGLPASTGGAVSGVALAEIYHLRDLVALEPFNAARSTNATGLDIFRELSASDPTHNRIISPYSIESALALAYVKNTLEALGMRTAFDDPRISANFDGMAPRHVPDDYLAIDDIYHQIWIALDENGTEAAAATGVTATVPQIAILEPLEMRVDRPFLFAIQHRPTGVCLFLGQIIDPS